MPDLPQPPDQGGASLVNLIAEIEHRLTGTAASDRLRPDLAEVIPEASTYVVVLFDGLGTHQLRHPAARTLADAHRGSIDAPFPSTTTVSLATIATGLPARRHGLLGHLIRLPELGVVNALKWIGRGGRTLDVDTASFLPSPNLWERLDAAGVEAITVQPGAFMGTPLTRALYRGARFEPVWSHAELAQAVVDLAAVPNRLIFAYLADVDFAAHLFGQRSGQYEEALRIVAATWDAISAGLPSDVVAIGTADHGHIDYLPEQKIMLSSADLKGLDAYGDPRALFLHGATQRAAALAETLPGRWLPLSGIRGWWGAGPEHPEFETRAPTGIVLADPGTLLVPGHMDRRLVGYHGGLEPEELSIPVLVGEG